MRLTFCILFFHFVLLTSYGQQHPYAVKFSHQLEKGIAEGSISASRAATLYSFIGDYYTSNTYSDIAVSWGVDSLDLSAYQLKDALESIVDAAKNHQIVIISENHLKPQHRIFASQIITELSHYGFDHLALETLMSTNNRNTLFDSMLVERGYPLNSPITGTYTMEPRMGNLVRNAIESDYQLFAYERSEKIKGLDRDEIQADNAIRYLKSHPNEKVIIVCGFHHAIESKLPKRVKHRWMANYIKTKMKLEPLTIYQDNFTEKFIENEHPILKEIQIDRPSVFVDSEGRLVHVSKQVDIEVIHPKTSYLEGRPDWLYEGSTGIAHKVRIDRKATSFPVLVSAYPIGEINSVPVDRIELKHKYDQKALVLKKGKYRVEIFDGELIQAYEITID